MQTLKLSDSLKEGEIISFLGDVFFVDYTSITQNQFKKSSKFKWLILTE